MVSSGRGGRNNNRIPTEWRLALQVLLLGKGWELRWAAGQKARSDLVDDEKPAAYMTSEGITDRENNNKIDTRVPPQSDAN
jgi:hypothetical protein